MVTDEAFSAFLKSLYEEKKDSGRGKEKRSSKIKRRTSKSPK